MEDQRGKTEIYQQRNRVDDRRDERARHDSRVEADLLCDHRQDAANQLGRDNRDHQRAADGRRHRDRQTVKQKQLDKIAGCQRNAAKGRYPQLLPDRRYHPG